MSQDYEAYYIPRYLDEPERILFWSLDEFAVMLAPIIVIGFLFNMLLTSFVIAFLANYFWRRLKGSEHANIHLYALYWFYPNYIMQMKGTPPSHIRQYFG